MNALRLPIIAVAIAALHVAVAGLGACSSPPNITFSVCNTPTVGEVGTDGKPDPCHCDPPASLAITTCGCLSGTPTDRDQYHACMIIYAQETADAGGTGGSDGGPIGQACNGACWPLPPDGYGTPQLLWFGPAESVPPCPEVAPAVVYGGDALGPAGGGTTTALACGSTASGACPGLGTVCGPSYATGFSQCVTQPGSAGCPVYGPYEESHVFEVRGADRTFCCLASPVTQ